MWGRGFGRGFGRGWGLGGWGQGRGFGRGFGFGARMGYCPWTGLPRGFRWGYGYSTAYNYNNMYGPQSFGPYVPGASYTQFQPANSNEFLKQEAEALRRRLSEIENRMEELGGK